MINDSVMFPRLREFTARIQANSSANAKQEILKEYPDLQEVLKVTYDPFRNYYVSSDNVNKQKKTGLMTGPNLFGGNLAASAKSGQVYNTLEDLLTALSTRAVTGLAAIRAIIQFSSKYKMYEDLILDIIDRDLKLRMDFKSINKVFPGLLSVFDVALAQSYWDRKDEVNFDKDVWYASRKLDGCRCIVVIDKAGDIETYGRSGKPFMTLQRIKDEIKEVWLNLRNVAFDGELCIVDEDGNEHFDLVMKEITKKNHTIASPRYQVFDMLTLEEFGSLTSTTTLTERLARFDRLEETAGKSPMITKLAQTRVTSQNQFDELFADAQKNGYEGLIIRKDTTYEGKRTKNMLKVKMFSDAEFVVEGMETGIFRYVKDGAEVTGEEMLTAVWITFTGTLPETLGKTNRVDVGSGFKLEERQRFFKDPTQIVGKTITVQWFEETMDSKTGLPSLRFPTLKAIYGEERDI